MPGHTHGCPRQCATPGTDNANHDANNRGMVSELCCTEHNNAEIARRRSRVRRKTNVMHGGWRQRLDKPLIFAGSRAIIVVHVRMTAIFVPLTINLHSGQISSKSIKWFTDSRLYLCLLCSDVRYLLSPICLSSVTFVHPTQAVQIFCNISTAIGTLAIH